MPAKGIQAHKLFKLGKAPAKTDVRNLMLAAILKAPPKLPKEFDFDLKHTGIPLPMFANDELGCCVISGRAHQTLRFEDLEQGSVINLMLAAILKAPPKLPKEFDFDLKHTGIPLPMFGRCF